MASKAKHLEFALEQIQAAGVITSRAMFGEYGIYCDGKIVALFCDDELFVKPTPAGRAFAIGVEEGPPYPGAKPYLRVADKIEEKDWLTKLIRITAESLPSQKRPLKKGQKPTEDSLLADIRGCTLCAKHLPMGPRPVLQFHPDARILIAGQAPGKRVHLSGIPFADVSGNRLRDWLGMSSETFYDPHQVAILPMGFCFPGTSASGDLPPRPECAEAWRSQLLSRLTNLKLTLVLGQYALDYHLTDGGTSVTAAVLGWQKHWPETIPLPHPSPRNQLWVTKNPWFEKELIPQLRIRVAEVLGEPKGSPKDSHKGSSIKL